MKNRDSNIELLRIVTTVFILILHCNGWFLKEWGGITVWNTGNSLVAGCRILIQNITVLGVDAFILISGFYGIRPKLKSIVNLFTLLLFFYVGCYLWECGLGKIFTWEELKINLLAFTRTNWFINGYMFLMLLSPIINAFVESTTTKKLGFYTTVYCLVTLYFGYYMGNQYWYYNEAFSVTMMVGVYLVGRFLNKISDKLENIKYWHIVLAFVALIGIMSLIRVLSSNEEAWLNYGSPITIIASVLLFLLFFRLPKFHSKFINWVGVSCLASFILHTCEPVFSWFVQKDVMYFTNEPFLIYCLKIGVVILGIFFTSILLDKVRLLIFSPIISLSGKIKSLN